MVAGTIESGFVRGEERWLAQESTGRSVSLSYDHIIQSLAVSAPGRDKVYFIAPSKSHLKIDSYFTNVKIVSHKVLKMKILMCVMENFPVLVGRSFPGRPACQLQPQTVLLPECG